MSARATSGRRPTTWRAGTRHAPSPRTPPAPPHDLARWDAALAAPGLLGAASLRALFTSYAAATNSFGAIPGTRYGYGWCLAELEGHPLRFHPGDNAGFWSFNIHVPGRDAGIVVLANDENGNPREISRRLVRGLLGHPAR